jgi:hypothetical protein
MRIIREKISSFEFLTLSRPKPRGAIVSAAQNSKLKLKILRARLDGQHLAALVKSAGRADAVRHIRRVALGAFAQLRELEHTVVSPAHMLPAR